MVLTWFIGVHGLNIGFSSAAFLRAGMIPDTAAALRGGTLGDAFEVAVREEHRAMLTCARVAFPLAVAEVILSGLLVVASGLAMGGRQGSRGLALQAIGANALLAVAAFALTPALRAAYSDGFLQAVDMGPSPPRERAARAELGVIQWGLRDGPVAFPLAVLALGAVALTRARTRTYFEAMARATESADEP
jgi:hypothetical protein